MHKDKISLFVYTISILLIGISLSGVVKGTKRFTKDKNKNILNEVNPRIRRSIVEDSEEEEQSGPETGSGEDWHTEKRRFNIPKNYDKLHIPVLSRKAFNTKLNGTSGLKYNISTLASVFFDDTDEDTVPSLDLMVDVLIRSIRDIDELNEEISVEMDFIVSWTDMLLCLENKCYESIYDDVMLMVLTMESIDPIFLKNIWKPDLFIENLVSISRPDVMSKPIKVLFSPKGLIMYQTRITVKLDCNMEFQYYPADTQHCVFRIRSYSHGSHELGLDWNEDYGRNGVFIKNRDENNFDVKIDGVTAYTLTESENLLFEDYNEFYRVLEFTISLRRKMSYHLIQTYLPSVFFIIITWLCFLVPTNMVEARIGVRDKRPIFKSMTTLLTLTSMFAAVRESTPIVSYVKAIDIWMVACIFSVFLTLFEFTLLIWLQSGNGKSDSQSQEGENQKSTRDGPGAVPREQNDKIWIRFLHKKKPKLTNQTKQKIAEWIEKWAFLMFSILFITFNVIYWSWLLSASNYFDWKVDPKYNGPDPDDL